MSSLGGSLRSSDRRLSATDPRSRSTATGPPSALADPDRVAQIMRILVDNALTHTPQGTSISIMAQSRDGAAKLVVADDGPGIDPHVRTRVFDRFYTGDRVSGSGLGLAIAHELAVLMDGELRLASESGAHRVHAALADRRRRGRREVSRRRVGARRAAGARRRWRLGHAAATTPPAQPVPRAPSPPPTTPRRPSWSSRAGRLRSRGRLPAGSPGSGHDPLDSLRRRHQPARGRRWRRRDRASSSPTPARS